MAEKHVAEVLERSPRAVKGIKLLVLWRMAAYANDQRLVWVSVDTLINETHASQTAVYEALSWLRDAGILQEVDESTLPEWMRRYPSTVRRITEPELWNDLTPAPVWAFPDSGNSQSFRNPEPDKSVDTFPDSVGLIPDSGGSIPESGPYKASLLSEEIDICNTSYYPASPGSQSKSRRSWKAEPEEDFDPRSSIAGEDEIPGTPQRTAPRAGYRRAGPDTAMGLAWTFRDAAHRTGEVYGLDIQAVRSLASHIKRWLTEGDTPDTIRSMIKLFLVDPQLRGEGPYAWKTFVARRAEMASRIAAESLTPLSGSDDTTDPEIGPQKSSDPPDDDDWVDPFA